MTYTADALQEYPFPVDGQLERGDGAEITFIHREEDDGVIAPPTRAEWHVEEWIENTQYDTRVNIHRRNIAKEEDVKRAQGLGFIIPLPGEMAFSRRRVGEDAPEWALSPGTSFGRDSYVTPSSNPPETGLDYQTFVVDTRWAVDVPEGYSLLIMTPFFMKPDTYSIMPQVIDPGVGRTWIRATMLLYKPDIRIQYSDPFLQVIPFKRDGLRLDAVVDRSVEESESDNAS